MKLRSMAVLFAFLLGGCAAYKELQPDPPIMPAERGYIELKNGKNNFELDAGKKYFIKFPRPMKDHFKLVLTAPAKPSLHAFLTREFEGKEEPYTPIANETATDDSTYVYAVDPGVPLFYWLIDSVYSDIQLILHYRYVPEWRYTFEVRYAGYAATLRSNRVDRSAYEGITATSDLNTINAGRDLSSLQPHTEQLRKLSAELNSLAAVFPEDIAASQDTAYKQYVELKGKLDDEVDFQQNYARVLSVIKIDRETAGDVAAFLDAVPTLADHMNHARDFPSGAAQRLRSEMGNRLDEVAPYFDRLLSAKSDVSRIAPVLNADAVSALYSGVGKPMPRELTGLARFIQEFNSESDALAGARVKLRDLDRELTKSLPTAGEQFFTAQAGTAGRIKQSIPDAAAGRMDRYGNYACAVQMTQEIAATARQSRDEEVMYQGAAQTAGLLSAHMWGASETGLRQLSDAATFTSAASLAEQRGQIIRKFERDLFDGVKLASQQRVDQFAKANETTIDNVPMLYQDSVFTPVYQLTYSSIGPGDLDRKRKEISDYLDGMKYVQFPETAIKAIYASFIRDINDRGVDKARAIVAHGKYYRGTDKQVKGLIDECDPTMAKWIVKAKDYRRLFAFPVTTNPRGTNDYLFRLGLRIPSEAQFPVFDVNIKLPQDVARKAGTEQWYQEITLNRKPIRNEGRFRITAPVADNNYESQISPVELDKDGNNVLEIRFKYPGYKVFEISAMAQVPIIRKN